jgi:hypothetical protein
MITPQKAGITPQKAKIKLEWDYSPKGKTLNWSGITLQKAKINHSSLIFAFCGVIALQFNFCLLGSIPTPV